MFSFSFSKSSLSDSGISSVGILASSSCKAEADMTVVVMYNTALGVRCISDTHSQLIITPFTCVTYSDCSCIFAYNTLNTTIKDYENAFRAFYIHFRGLRTSNDPDGG